MPDSEPRASQRSRICFSSKHPKCRPHVLLPVLWWDQPQRCSKRKPKQGLQSQQRPFCLSQCAPEGTYRIGVGLVADRCREGPPHRDLLQQLPRSQVPVQGKKAAISSALEFRQQESRSLRPPGWDEPSRDQRRDPVHPPVQPSRDPEHLQEQKWGFSHF